MNEAVVEEIGALFLPFDKALWTSASAIPIARKPIDRQVLL